MSSQEAKRNYYAEILNEEDRAFYEKCLSHISRGKFSITGDVGDPERIDEASNGIMTAVIMGCPELFFLDQNVTFTYSGSKLTLTFANKYRDRDLVEMNRQLEAEIDRICKKIATYKTTYEKIYRLNQYLCRRVEPILSAKSKYSDAYAALIDRNARCEGFAKAAKLILDKLGIESYLVDGDADTEYGRIAHAWNLIMCDGKAYQFDFTWNASLLVNKAPGIAYMFLNDEDISVDHHTEYVFPQCTDGSLEPWNVANGAIKYISDMSRAKPIPIGHDYIVPIRFTEPMDARDVNDHCLEWARSELSPQNISQKQCARFVPRLNVVLYYFLNE